jgi:hypothetical protein
MAPKALDISSLQTYDKTFGMMGVKIFDALSVMFSISYNSC